ncbi:NAD(P)H-dependent oxidoreductase [Pseudoalteromonas sp. JBTF-M23]|uniref:NAD(P)H-dependent oxidoreductase n=1 Tax=Pseudoalteromonas caenipelagi TaxID=2726988 RepID=A0A849VKV8_9GAMM|nr:NAD(P)H-dependent oxidoreductase [Pseudoalteromonas caenipelagi]NOU52247.1 NAD(P)H-dependent oxidoreductase [Pseudoalteromonas caenipelagi]
MRKTVILFSSANKSGNTFKLVNLVMTQLHAEQVKLVSIDDLEFSDYTYSNKYTSDDFYLVSEALDWADNIVFASPVYWHSVSSNMKRLIDRMTELTENPTIKPIGKGLKGKQGYVLTTSASAQVCEIFSGFFDKLFSYFGIHNTGLLHVSCRNGFALTTNTLNQFTQHLNSQKA